MWLVTGAHSTAAPPSCVTLGGGLLSARCFAVYKLEVLAVLTSQGWVISGQASVQAAGGAFGDSDPSLHVLIH